MTPKDAASILPRKDMEGQIRDVDDNGSFSMYALVFGNVDRQGDIIEAGAVKNTDEFTKDGWIALGHDHGSLPVAMIDSAQQDGVGLKLNGTFHTTPDAQAVRTIIKERLKAGKSVKTSIGYLPLTGGEHFEKQGAKTVRRLSKINVYEASFVNLPANPLAEVISAKSASEVNTEDRAKLANLETKAGRKISASNLNKLKGYAAKAAEHHAAISGLIEAHKGMIDEFNGYLGGFDPVQDDPNETAMPDALKNTEAVERSQEEAKRLELKRRALSLKFPTRG